MTGVTVSRWMPGPVLGNQLRANGWLAPAAGVLLVVFTVIGVLNGVDGSMWENASYAARWIAFASAVVTAAMLPVYVAHGVTRRTYATAGAVTAVVVATVGGVFVSGGYLLERAVYGAIGGDHSPWLSDRHLFAHTGQPHLVFAEYAPVLAAYLASGWLVGLAYYRFGVWRGTLCLPLTLAPVAGAEVALTAHLHGDVPGWSGAASPLLPAAGVLLVALAGLVAVRVFIRGVPVRTGN